MKSGDDSLWSPFITAHVYIKPLACFEIINPELKDIFISLHFT